MADDQRCADAKQFQRMDSAFRAGDLDALRAAAADPALIPNGPMPAAIGSCLVYSIYHSPFAFIRTLLEIGADPNLPAGDGFPPLIAALSCARPVPGAKRRPDVCDIMKLLLEFGANPNQRGVNGYTPLHMAVEAGDARAVQVLLESGADPELRTRIDDCQTPLEMAAAAGLEAIAAILKHRDQPIRRRLRSGLYLLTDIPGNGDVVRRQHTYRIRLCLWLSQGEAVRWVRPWGPVNVATLLDNGQTLITEVLINRGRLINGLFYGVEGMRVGGTRRLEIASHMAYGDHGVPGVIPPGAGLTAEITMLEEPKGGTSS